MKTILYLTLFCLLCATPVTLLEAAIRWSDSPSFKLDLSSQDTPTSVFANSPATANLGSDWYWNSLFGYFYHGYYPFLYVWSTSEWVYVTGDSESYFFFYRFTEENWGWGNFDYYPSYVQLPSTFRRWPTPPPEIDGFALIPAGAFIMGSPENELGRATDETTRNVTISRPFYMAKTEVSWNSWNEVRTWAMANGYTISTGSAVLNNFITYPVSDVSWRDAIYWCNARSQKEGLTAVYYTSDSFTEATILKASSSTVYANWNANGYRLPTEAEWEYACRAGTTTALYSGEIVVTDCEIDPNLAKVGWYCANGYQAHPLEQLTSNAWDLADMNGNVYEWCWDQYGAYDSESLTDPRGPDTSSINKDRVLRGGSFSSHVEQCRSASRFHSSPSGGSSNWGFRPAISVPQK